MPRRLPPPPPPGSDHRISYWLKNRGTQNFGDYLSELFFQALTAPGGGTPRGPYAVIHLLGSVISPHHINTGLEHTPAGPGPWIAFWGCGLREETRLSREAQAACVFHGVRGPLTRKTLRLPADTPLGDPALLLPLLHKPRPHKLAGKTICVPHHLDAKTDEELLHLTKADAILRPGIPANLEAALTLIDAIAGASLILGGALHANITAAAYNTPFAYLDTGYIDVPFKWRDFAASAKFEPDFVQTADQGATLYESKTRRKLRLPKLRPILAACPLKPPAKLLAKATRRDAG